VGRKITKRPRYFLEGLSGLPLKHRPSLLVVADGDAHFPTCVGNFVKLSAHFLNFVNFIAAARANITILLRQQTSIFSNYYMISSNKLASSGKFLACGTHFLFLSHLLPPTSSPPESYLYPPSTLPATDSGRRRPPLPLPFTGAVPPASPTLVPPPAPCC
jgi:hypothetical protein